MKKICLDIGNVLCDVDFDPFFTQMNKLGVDKDESFLFLSRIQSFQDLGHSKLEWEIWHTFKFNKSDIHLVVDSWMNSIKINETSQKALSRLVDLTEVAFLSNMGHEHNSILSEKIGDAFHKATKHMSCEVGARKPHKIFFKMFLEDHPHYKNALYIDDRHENLDTGKKVGFDTHHFDTSVSSKEEQEIFWNKIFSLL